MYEIKSTVNLKKVMKDYFTDFLKPGKVAWCTSVGPAELLRSFGFKVYFPENHGALLGATRLAGEYIPETVSMGYAGDICSYLTSDIGAYLKGETPLTKHYGLPSIPKPDLIVYNTNQCREVQDWFNYYGTRFNCPSVGIFPPRHISAITQSEIDDVARQMEELVPVCEKTSGVKFDIDRFREVLKKSKIATNLWKDVLATAKNTPAPLCFFDGAIHMGPIVVLRGTDVAVEYYRGLLQELNDNVKKGLGMIPGERTRMYWDGMPIWGKLRNLSDLFCANHSSVVASTYCNSWVFDAFDEKDPFRSSAEAYTVIFINRSEEAKFQLLKSIAEEYKVDGMVFHDAKTCFNNSNSRFGLPQRFSSATGIPSLVIEGDLCDLRFYSEGQSVTKLETFIEQLEGIKEIS
ncbi:MAG: 2-hydroxyacyl-CoA dehydratase [Bacteroidia bacterium]|nr:2-hydroxyacyl-CoA dehydratase [Bacteroidia bacterium]